MHASSDVGHVLCNGIETVAIGALRCISQRPHLRENQSHFMTDLVMNIASDALPLIRADEFHLGAELSILLLDDLQRVGKQSELAAKAPAVSAQGLELPRRRRLASPAAILLLSDGRVIANKEQAEQDGGSFLPRIAPRHQAAEAMEFADAAPFVEVELPYRRRPWACAVKEVTPQRIDGAGAGFE
jgi:hypothetical protein